MLARTRAKLTQEEGRPQVPFNWPGWKGAFEIAGHLVVTANLYGLKLDAEDEGRIARVIAEAGYRAKAKGG